MLSRASAMTCWYQSSRSWLPDHVQQDGITAVPGWCGGLARSKIICLVDQVAALSTDTLELKTIPTSWWKMWPNYAKHKAGRVRRRRANCWPVTANRKSPMMMFGKALRSSRSWNFWPWVRGCAPTANMCDKQGKETIWDGSVGSAIVREAGPIERMDKGSTGVIGVSRKVSK